MSTTESTPATRYIPCPSCGTANAPTSQHCRECGAYLAGERHASPAAATHGTSANQPSAVGTQVVGWVIFGASIIAALVVWSEFGTIEVPTGGVYSFSSHTITNPVAGWAAFGIVAQGFAWLVLFLGVARAAENSEGARQEIAALRKQLEQQGSRN